jgi:2,3-dihydroxyphenylpropionate 1,2-dioxygenase
MAKVISGFAMSHAPGMIGWPETIAPAEVARMHAACGRIAAYLSAHRPDVIIAFLDDHFEQLYRTFAPTFAIGVADTHSGPPEYWQPVLKLDAARQIAGRQDLASHVLNHTVHAGFDMARMGSVEYGNNLIVAWELIGKPYDIPVIPVFVNVYHPPLPTMDRAFRLGAAIRDAVEIWDRDVTVGFVATGGLSHWPPIWLEHIHSHDDAELDTFLRNIKRYQIEGRKVLKEIPDLMLQMGQYEQRMMETATRPLTNPEWDREFLALLAKGDVRTIRGMSYADIEEGGGFGGHEVLNWAALMGAMRGASATIIDYQSVPQWITGIGYAAYDD